MEAIGWDPSDLRVGRTALKTSSEACCLNRYPAKNLTTPCMLHRCYMAAASSCREMGRRQALMALMEWAITETRLHEEGIASNHGSARRGVSCILLVPIRTSNAVRRLCLRGEQQGVRQAIWNVRPSITKGPLGMTWQWTGMRSNPNCRILNTGMGSNPVSTIKAKRYPAYPGNRNILVPGGKEINRDSTTIDGDSPVMALCSPTPGLGKSTQPVPGRIGGLPSCFYTTLPYAIPSLAPQAAGITAAIGSGPWPAQCGMTAYLLHNGSAR
ncbi:12534_t:CDS:2 [Funneliformis geosporum]|nr:12534_t:CDS:2 [Funneliformis geosporum]